MLRRHIERIARFPVTTIILAIFATVLFAYQFKDLHMVLDPKAILPQDHPYVKLNNEIEKQFGGSRVVVIGVASKDGDIFNPSDIEKIRLINEEAKKLPGILENNVVSIADRKVKYVKAEGDSLEIKGLLEGIEYTPEGMELLKQRVYSNPMFINSLISEDGTVAAIILDFKGGATDWGQKTENGEGQKSEVRSKKSEVRSQKQEVVAQFIGQIDQPDKSGNYSSDSEGVAWAEEDWKKWQGAGSGTDEKSEVRSQKSEEGSSALPSPFTGEGQGGGGQRPAEGEAGKWPAGGEGGWPASGGGEKEWEQWYVSDATIHKKVLEIVDKYKDANTEIYVGGLPIALSFLEADSWRMSRYIYPLALFVIMFVLYFAFRSIQGMILPIVCALLSVVWAVGLMGVFNIPLDPWNMMTPILILAVAAGHSVQILKRYYEELEKSPPPLPSPVKGEGVKGGDTSQFLPSPLAGEGKMGAQQSIPFPLAAEEQEPEKTPSPLMGEGGGGGGHWGADASRQAVVESLTKIGPVMITAGIVAAASFASLLTFQLKTFQSFGLFTAFGILSALILEMTFIPAARSLMRPPKKAAGNTPTPALPHQGGGSKGRGDLAVSTLPVRGGEEKGGGIIRGGGSTGNYGDSIPSPLAGEGEGGGAGSILDRFLLGISRLVTQRSWLVWLGLVVVIAISFYGINRLTVINSLKGLFFESTQFRKDDAALNKYFGGTATFYVYIEGQPDSLKDPAVLRAIEGLQHEIELVPEVGKTQSYVDYVKAMNQSMHGGDAAYRAIPDDQSTISEYLFLFSISGSQGEMDRFLDYQYQKSVIWVFLRDDSTVLGEKLIAIVNKYSPPPQPSPVKGEGVEADGLPSPLAGEGVNGGGLPSPLAGEGVKEEIAPQSIPSPLVGEGQGGGAGFPPGIKVGVAGSIPVMMALNQTMVAGKIWNILQIAGIVFAISSTVLRSPVGGILVLLPLGIAVLVNFGVLGIAGIGLGVGTAAISAMAVGFGADYSIYLLYRLREEVAVQKSPPPYPSPGAPSGGEGVTERDTSYSIPSPLEGEGKGGGDQRSTVDAAIRQTLLTAGKAIIFVALALAAGGVTLLFTGYYLHMEGFLVPLAMLTSSLATLIVLPVVTKLIKPGFIYKMARG